MKKLAALCVLMSLTGLASASVLDDARCDLTVNFIERTDSSGAPMGDGRWLIQGCPLDNNIVVGTWKEGNVVKGITVNINATTYGYYPTDLTSTGKRVIGIAVRGWEGNDIIDLSDIDLKAFRLNTTPGFSVEITGDQGDDEIRGSVINDVIYGNDGDDDINGGDGNDILLGGFGNDLLKGSDGHDVLEGEEGDYDRLFGGCGNDKLGDKDGVRTARGADGNDKLIITFRPGWTLNGKTKSVGLIVGGADADTFEIYNQGSSALTVTLEGDLDNGYNDSGDQAFFTGSFMEAATQPHVETVTGP